MDCIEGLVWFEGNCVVSGVGALAVLDYCFSARDYDRNPILVIGQAGLVLPK